MLLSLLSQYLSLNNYVKFFIHVLYSKKRALCSFDDKRYLMEDGFAHWLLDIGQSQLNLWTLKMKHRMEQYSPTKRHATADYSIVGIEIRL